MNFKRLFQTDKTIRAGLIGTGTFGKSFLFQVRRTPHLEIPVVCDQDMDAAVQAALHGGTLVGDIVRCATASEAATAIIDGKTAVVGDGTLLADLPLDVIVEATGSPEAGARHALAAIEAGKHVVMVSKEAATVVGPILAHKAEEAGVVYTTGDGDQPSMCIGLISWAESIGLEVVCAGKASEADFIYDEATGTVSNGRGQVQVANTTDWDLWSMAEGDPRARVSERNDVLAPLSRAGIPEYTEMSIVMNNTNIGFDRPTLHAPFVRIQEIADIMRHVDDGGILTSTPVIDVINCLRRPDEVGFAGGVFVVFKCHDRETWQMLRRKGHLLSRDGSHAMIYLPYHLLGVETATSIFSAALLGLPTGGSDVRPVADVGIVATDLLAAGRRLAMDRGHAIPGVEPTLLHPGPVAPAAAIPFYLAAGNELTVDVAQGTTLTYDMIEEPADSVLWALKRKQTELATA